MNQALVDIVVNAIKEKYVSEKAFYQGQLGISGQSWDRWKKGEHGLRYENLQIVATLFTDYEWMLVQKVVRNSEIMSNVIKYPVNEYMFMKYQIAKQWINSGIARVEWQKTNENEEDSQRKSNYMVLKVIIDYNLWGYNDIIELRLPGVIQQQIGHDEVKLLQWVDDESEKLKEQNLIDD